MITTQVLAALGIGAEWSRPLNDAMGLYLVDGTTREAMFIAQMAHESGGFKTLEENLNYSAAALLKQFPSHFTPQEAADYARDPERIANRVYADRMENGNEASGDGWKYRGRGVVQLTGRQNYRLCGKSLGLDLLTHPDVLTDPTYAALAGGWFWGVNGCNELADAGAFASITRRINGSGNPAINGQADRLNWLAKVQAAINGGGK